MIETGRVAFLAGASIAVGGIIVYLGGLGMTCPFALMAIGPLLVTGFHLSLQPLFRGRRTQPYRPSVVFAGAIVFPALGAAILHWRLCDPLIAMTLLTLGPAIALGQSWSQDEG